MEGGRESRVGSQAKQEIEPTSPEGSYLYFSPGQTGFMLFSPDPWGSLGEISGLNIKPFRKGMYILILL